jgi:hypothetical protein
MAHWLHGRMLANHLLIWQKWLPWLPNQARRLDLQQIFSDAATGPFGGGSEIGG